MTSDGWVILSLIAILNTGILLTIHYSRPRRPE